MRCKHPWASKNINKHQLVSVIHLGSIEIAIEHLGFHPSIQNMSGFSRGFPTLSMDFLRATPKRSKSKMGSSWKFHWGLWADLQHSGFRPRCRWPGSPGEIAGAGDSWWQLVEPESLTGSGGVYTCATGHSTRRGCNNATQAWDILSEYLLKIIRHRYWINDHSFSFLFHYHLTIS